MQPAIHVNGTLVTADVRRAAYFYMLRRGWRLALGPWMIVIAFVTLCVGANYTPSEQDWITNLFSVLFFLLLSAAWVLCVVMAPRRKAKQLAGQGYLAEPVTYTFTARGIASSRATAGGRVGWNVITAVRETAHLFLLDCGTGGFVLVPKRFFPGAGEMQAWRGSILEWIAPKRIEKPGIAGRWC